MNEPLVSIPDADSDSRLVEDVHGSPIDVLDWPTALARIAAWAGRRESRVVCICNVHSVVTARRDRAFGEILRRADMNTPDGAPIAWAMRRFGRTDQRRINGPDLMWKYAGLAAAKGQSIYLYGGTPKTLALLQDVLRTAFPNLVVAGAYSPPFRSLTSQEDADAVAAINRSGAGTVWVSLGCPKQERWMDAHRGRVDAVMIGVGAAFDYHAGVIARAPRWMQNAGLEWAHRLASEPRRLFRRYAVTNSMFILGMVTQLAARRARPGDYQQ